MIRGNSIIAILSLLITTLASSIASDRENIISFELERILTKEQARAPELSLATRMFLATEEIRTAAKAYLLGQSIGDVSLNNEGNFIYLATLYIGSQKQPLNCQIDTGSNRLVLQSQNCTDCSLDRFNQSQSTTFVATQYADSITYVDGTTISGYKDTDTVALDKAGVFSVKAFNFLLADSASGLYAMDGILGMTKPSFPEYNMFVDQLYQAGIISSGVFSLYLANYSVQSSMQVGGYNSSYFKQGLTNITYIPLVSDPIFWLATVNGFRVGYADFFSDSTPAGYQFSSPRIGVLDSGTSILYPPYDVFSDLIAAVLHGLPYSVIQGTYYGPCNLTQYQSLFIAISGSWFEVPPSVYVYPAQQGQTICPICLEPGGDNTWVLGDTFLMSYYSIWDYANNQIGLIPHKTSSASVSNVTALPVTVFSLITEADIIGQIVTYVAAGTIAVAIVAAVLGINTAGIYLILQELGVFKIILDQAISLSEVTNGLVLN